MKDGPNVYLYVHNNPINRIDPLGLEDEGGHHVVPKATWDKEKLQPGVKEIYDGKDARLTSEAYKSAEFEPSHNNKTLNGVRVTEYNNAVRDISKATFNGKLPHELNAEQAKILVDKITKISQGEASEGAAKYVKDISKYNNGVKAEIKVANVAMAAAGKVVSGTARVVGGVAKAAGKIAKPVALVVGAVNVARAETPGEAAHAVWDAVDPTFGLAEAVIENGPEIVDKLSEEPGRILNQFSHGGYDRMNEIMANPLDNIPDDK